MKRRRIIRAGALLALLAPAACRHTEPAVEPPPSEISRFDQGRALYFSEELKGEGGRACAGCHEHGRPFEGHQLARRLYELPSAISSCLLGHSKRLMDDQTPDQVESLRVYLVHRFVHEGQVRSESDEAMRRLGEAMALFIEGHYEQALTEVQSAHRMIRTEHYHVRALLLEGCIHVFRLATDKAKLTFSAALGLDPDIRVDANIFSPKVSAVLEETRAELKLKQKTVSLEDLK
ncbi:MAG: hypothetical protein IT384_17190 [Deltaproteobacteria bacterium]|nr:hypothetical protein [Deltaproteobacteria bacterium]